MATTELAFKTIYGINNIEVLGKKSYSKRWFFLNPVKRHIEN
jgi:hypothetical protein